jgi:hypothetical protein
MKVWSIRHKPTGAWMPSRMSRSRGGGWSSWIPGPPQDGWGGCDGYDKNPRIFFSLPSARNALTMWLQGVWESRVVTTTDWEGFPDDYDDLTVRTPPVERKREDMEIVELELTGGGL